jgi:phage-related protein (TIGR01555 family)
MTKPKTGAPSKKPAGPKPPLTVVEVPEGEVKQATDNAITDPQRIKAFDAFQNLLARLGYQSNNLLESTRYPITRISNQYMLMQSLYRSNWIAQRIADTFPEEMCKIAPKLICQAKPKNISSFNRVVSKTGIWRKIEWAMKLANIFGGAGAIIVLKGQENHLDEPLDFDDIRPDSFRGVIPFDRWSGITPSATVCSDIDKPLDYGLPESYRVTKANGGGFDIHASRVLRFTGRDLPLWEQQAMMYWGESVYEAAYEEIVKRDNTSFNIVSLMFRAQLLALKDKGLAAQLSGLTKNTASLEQFTRILSTQSQLMSNQGLLVTSEEGGLDSHQYTFGGIADVYHEFMKDIAAAAEIPFEILFGRDSGLGDSGEGSLQTFYDRVAHKQATKLDPALEKLYPVIAMSTWGEIPDDFAWKFPIARTVTNAEKAELADKLNKPVIEAFNAGLISQEIALQEFQENSDETGVFSNVTDEFIAKADKEVQQPGEMMGGEGAGAFGSPKVTEPSPTGKDAAPKSKLKPLDCDQCGAVLKGGYEMRGDQALCKKCAAKPDPKGKDKKLKGRDEVFPANDPYSAPLGSVQAMRKYHGLDVVIETPKGQRRQGKEWRWTIPADYGYIAETKGADGDEIDCYVGPNPESPMVYVVDQSKLYSDRFDEHKVMLGYQTEDEARSAYLAGHTNGREIFRGITPMTMDEFKAWLERGERKRPLFTPTKFNRAIDCVACESGDCILHGNDEWNESEHPRVAEGPGGGQFAPAGASKFGLKPGQSTEEAHRDDKGEWSAERKAHHDEIIKRHLEGKKPVEGGPDAYILGGGSASGKSTGFKAMYAKKFEDEILRIDSDAIKDEIPEYEELKKRDPENAARLVYEEASHIAKRMMASAAAKKIDMVYDSTGSWSGIQKMSKTLSDEGYKVHLIYFDVPIPEARKRAQARAERTGRHIPEEVIQKSHVGSAKNFMAMHESKHISSVNLYDNSGRVPGLVYSKKGEETGIIVDGEKWKEYSQKAGADERSK